MSSHKIFHHQCRHMPPVGVAPAIHAVDKSAFYLSAFVYGFACRAWLGCRVYSPPFLLCWYGNSLRRQAIRSFLPLFVYLVFMWVFCFVILLPHGDFGFSDFPTLLMSRSSSSSNSGSMSWLSDRLVKIHSTNKGRTGAKKNQRGETV